MPTEASGVKPVEGGQSKTWRPLPKTTTWAEFSSTMFGQGAHLSDRTGHSSKMPRLVFVSLTTKRANFEFAPLVQFFPFTIWICDVLEEQNQKLALIVFEFANRWLEIKLPTWPTNKNVLICFKIITFRSIDILSLPSLCTTKTLVILESNQ